MADASLHDEAVPTHFADVESSEYSETDANAASNTARRKDALDALVRIRSFTGRKLQQTMDLCAATLRRTPAAGPIANAGRKIAGTRIGGFGKAAAARTVTAGRRHPRLAAVCIGCAVVGIAALMMRDGAGVPDRSPKSDLELVIDEVQVFPAGDGKPSAGGDGDNASLRSRRSGFPEDDKQSTTDAARPPKPQPPSEPRPAWLTGSIETVQQRSSRLQTISHEQESPPRRPADTPSSDRYQRTVR